MGFPGPLGCRSAAPTGAAPAASGRVRVVRGAARCGARVASGDQHVLDLDGSPAFYLGATLSFDLGRVVDVGEGFHSVEKKQGSVVVYRARRFVHDAARPGVLEAEVHQEEELESRPRGQKKEAKRPPKKPAKDGAAEASRVGVIQSECPPGCVAKVDDLVPSSPLGLGRVFLKGQGARVRQARAVTAGRPRPFVAVGVHGVLLVSCCGGGSGAPPQKIPYAFWRQIV